MSQGRAKQRCGSRKLRTSDFASVSTAVQRQCQSLPLPRTWQGVATSPQNACGQCVCYLGQSLRVNKTPLSRLFPAMPAATGNPMYSTEPDMLELCPRPSPRVPRWRESWRLWQRPGPPPSPVSSSVWCGQRDPTLSKKKLALPAPITPKRAKSPASLRLSTEINSFLMPKLPPMALLAGKQNNWKSSCCQIWVLQQNHRPRPSRTFRQRTQGTSQAGCETRGLVVIEEDQKPFK